MTEGLYAELLDTNVNVSVIFPGAVATETSNSGVAIPGGAGDVEESKFPTTSPDDAAASSSTATKTTSSTSTSDAMPA